MRTRRDLLLLLLVASLAFGWSIGWPLADAHSYRQTWTASTARLFAREGIDLLHPRVDYQRFDGPAAIVLEFPVYQALVALLYRAFGEHEIIGRLVSALASLAAAAALYFALRARDRREALAAGVLALAAPVVVLYGRSYLVDPLSVALCTVFFGLGLRVLRHGGASLFEIALLTLVGVLAAVGKPLHLIVFGAGLLGYALARVRTADRAWLRGVVAAFAAPVTLLVAAGMAWRLHADAINLAQGDTRHVLLHFPGWFFGGGAPGTTLRTLLMLAVRTVAAVGPLALLLLPAAILTVRARAADPEAAAIGGLGLGALLYLIAFRNLNAVHAYYQLPVAVALAPVTAFALFHAPHGIAAWLRRTRWRAALAFGLSSVATLVAVVCWRANVTAIGFPWDRSLLEVAEDFRRYVPREDTAAGATAGAGRALFVVPSLRHAPFELLYFADVYGECQSTLGDSDLTWFETHGGRFVAIERSAAARPALDRMERERGAHLLGTSPRLAVFELAR